MKVTFIVSPLDKPSSSWGYLCTKNMFKKNSKSWVGIVQEVVQLELSNFVECTINNT